MRKSMEFFLCLLSLTTVHGVHLTINWTQVSTVPLGWETHLDQPPGAALASCTCDLTSGLCDLSCCCDRDCSSSSHDTPSCVSPAPQHQREESPVAYTCKYFGPFGSEWHSFFCPVKENTPYLGLFYPPHKIIRDYQKYLTSVRQQHYSYQEEGVHVPHQKYQPHYVHKEQVLVGRDLSGTVVEGPLVLPQPVFQGVCVGASVLFLEDLSHQCVVIMSPEKCESEAALSVASYLQPSDGTPDQPSGFLHVIGNLSSLGLVNASVEYEWMEDTTAFIKAQGGDVPTAWPQSTADTPEKSTLPYLDARAGWCHNVVLAVKYQLAWEGPAITDIIATITLGSVPVLTKPQERTCSSRQNSACPTPTPPKLPPLSATPQLLLLQHFAVKFQHVQTSSNASSNTSDLALGGDGVPDLLERSGNPGYLISRPLLAGYVEYNSTEEENTTAEAMLSVALNGSTGLYVWRPDVSGRCQMSLLEKVAFGIDVTSSCLYAWSDVTCSDLREMLEAALYSLVQAEVVSAFGWPNVSKEEDFLPIIFVQPEGNKTTGRGCVVPSSLAFEIIYQDVLDEPDPSRAIFQVLGAAVRLHYHAIHFPGNMSTGSHLLSAGATFTRHSKPSGLSRFWEAMEDRWCERRTCWREILWPWTHWLSRLGWTGHGSHSSHLADLLAHSLLGLALLVPPLVVALSQGFRLVW